MGNWVYRLHPCSLYGICLVPFYGHTCREELLEEVRAERLARGDAKKRSSSAVTIQRHWRGHAARQAMLAELASAFITDFSPGISAAQHQMPAEDVPLKLLPPALFLLLRSSGAQGRSAPLRLTKAPAQRRGCSAEGASALPGTSLLQVDSFSVVPFCLTSRLNLPFATMSKVVRCLLALLMRSATSLDASTCFLALSLSSPVDASDATKKVVSYSRLIWPETMRCKAMYHLAADLLIIASRKG